MPERLATVARLGAMFERMASVRDEADLQEVLEDVARTIGEVLGYGAVVVNVYRPAFDDMLTAAAVGSEESLQALLGTVSPNDTWTPLLADRFRCREGAYFVPDGEFDWDGLGVESYVPDLEPPDHPDAWLPGDALFVPLRDARHQLLGVISVDEPVTGMRPGDRELDALVTISRHAALALRIAQDIADDMQHQRMLERVLEVSARLAQARDVDAVLQAVSDGIQDALGVRMNSTTPVMLFPVYDTLSGSGSNAEYHIIGWVPFHILSYESHGNDGSITGYFTEMIWFGTLATTSGGGGPSFGARTVQLVE